MSINVINNTIQKFGFNSFNHMKYRFMEILYD